jgi:hypothetical protein
LEKNATDAGNIQKLYLKEFALPARKLFLRACPLKAKNYTENYNLKARYCFLRAL